MEGPGGQAPGPARSDRADLPLLPRPSCPAIPGPCPAPPRRSPTPAVHARDNPALPKPHVSPTSSHFQDHKEKCQKIKDLPVLEDGVCTPCVTLTASSLAGGRPGCPRECDRGACAWTRCLGSGLPWSTVGLSQWQGHGGQVVPQTPAEDTSCTLSREVWPPGVCSLSVPLVGPPRASLVLTAHANGRQESEAPSDKTGRRRPGPLVGEPR